VSPRSSRTPRRPRGRPTNPEAREERRQQILAGARRCFAEKGFHAASTADISEAAGVSVANLYQYFPSKHDLVNAIAEEDLRGDLALGALFAPPASLFDGLEAYAKALAEQARQRGVFPLRLEVFAESQRNPEIQRTVVKMDAKMVKGFVRVVEEAQRRGEIAAELDPRLVTSLIFRVLDGLALGIGTGQANARELIPHLAALLRGGLAPRAKKR
jgi:TetR/AcrR family transcriptional regulator, repressor for uid operon